MRNLSEKPAGALSKVAFPNPETTTVWSFPVRGTWATHNNKYRGNFAPQLARNVIETYSQPGEVILDPMAGGGTTLIEAKLLGRGFIGADINPVAVKLCEQATEFRIENLECRIEKDGPAGREKDKPKRDASATLSKIVCADARDLSFIRNASVDLILTHPPYLNIIHYSDKLDGDLSAISSVKKFRGEMRIIAGELLRVLKPGRYCAILMGDTRRGRHFVPLAYRVMDTFLDAGFILKEDIIKVQHNCSATSRWVGKAKKAGFYLIMHEHLFVFRKADKDEDLARVKESLKSSS
ncbi:MAG: DNA methyltransferase [Candidatus Omnitrophota bacterium]|jgi:DNA modification methylase